jgi:CDP-glucose 4,6-dehydratase
MESSARTVRELALAFAKNWGWSDVAYKFEQDMAPSEANLLLLDSSKARNLLGWKDNLTFEESIEMTVDWYKVCGKTSPSEFTRMQMGNYLQKLKLD